MNDAKFIDLVVAGPDFSGTSTQVNDIIKYLKNNRNLSVRDIRGTEFDALFHAEKFSYWNKDMTSLEEFRRKVHNIHYNNVIVEMHNLIEGVGYDPIRVASMVKNDKTEYVNPDSSDVWIMEEPTYRGAGQVSRSVETNRSKFNSTVDQLSTALTIQSDRVNEFLRFRKPLRDAGKIIIRSRSEESMCYQMYDEKLIPGGVGFKDYMNFPGNKLAFQHPPTHIFVVCGPEDWKIEDYVALKAERTGERKLDDFEKNAPYQLLVNQRYASNWLEAMYAKACFDYGSKRPVIHRFDIYHSKSEIKNEMNAQLDKIMSEYI